MVELLFLPSVYAPCPVCKGTRYNAKTLEVEYRGKSIADVLSLTVDAAWEFFAEEETLRVARLSSAKSGSAIFAWGNPRPNYPAEKPSASSSRVNSSDPERRHALCAGRADHRAASL